MTQHMRKRDKRKKLDENVLDFITHEMTDAVEKSKDEIFNISQEAQKDHEKMKQDLQDTKLEVQRLEEEGDRLEQKVNFSKKRLSEVSQDFDQYSEDEIRNVYEKTFSMQSELAMLREKERSLLDKCDDLENHIAAIDQTIKRADGLAGKIAVVTTYLNDDFRQVNEMIEEAREKQEFGLKIIEAQEEERRKISRDIHDGPAQMLANILLRSELVERTFREGSVDEAVNEIRNVRKMIRSSLFEVRRIIYDLRPMGLDDLGLIPTLKKYASAVSEHNAMDITFTPTGVDERLPQKYEIAIFRLVQEAIQNTIKHAGASLIKVFLEKSEDELVITIRDDGQGFDPGSKGDNSFGLIGMKERVEMLDGTMEIESIIDKGTTISVNIPLEEEEQSE